MRNYLYEKDKQWIDGYFRGVKSGKKEMIFELIEYLEKKLLAMAKDNYDNS